jgi:hypothetical protein
MTHSGGQGSEDAKTTRNLEERKKRHKVMDQAEERRGETERLEELKKKKKEQS